MSRRIAQDPARRNRKSSREEVGHIAGKNQGSWVKPSIQAVELAKMHLSVLATEEA
jgi:hypothetical protein